MALSHTSKDFESSLNNLKLFFSVPANWNRIIGGGGENMEFTGLLKKEHYAVEIPGVKLQRNGISRSVQEKFMLLFHRSWILTFGISKGCHKIPS